jgi:hypothetical protein
MKAAAQIKADAEKQLQSFIGKFEPAHQALIRGARKALRKRLPPAHELVYDNYNFFVIGYSPTTAVGCNSLDRGRGERRRHLLHSRRKPARPEKILRGSGKQTRSCGSTRSKI